MPELNPQGLTAQQMGQAAVDNAQRDVIQRAVNNPGTLVQGPQTGMTSASGNMAPTPTNFQAYTQPNGGGSIPLVSSSANPNVLTSADADSFVSRAQSRIQPETNVEYGTSTPRTVPGPSFYDQYGNADPIGVSARRLYGIQEERINKAYKPQEEQTAANLRNETLSSNAARFQTGQAGTEYGRMVMQDLADQHQRELDTLAMQKQQALNNAWDATLRGQVGVFVQQQAEAERLQQAAQQKKVDFYREQQEMIQLQKMDTQEGGAISNIVRAGITPTDAQLELLDGMRGYAKGTSRLLYGATMAEEEINRADRSFKDLENKLKLQQGVKGLQKDELEMEKLKNEIERSTYQQVTDLYSALDKVPAGQMVKIGNSTYFGTEGAGKIEIDEKGIGRMLVVDPTTGGLFVRDLGRLGKADKDKMQLMYAGGNPVLFNETTGEYKPLDILQQNNWDKVIPTGSKGGQCGTFIRTLTGIKDPETGLIPNSYEGKVKLVDPSLNPTNIQVGDVFVQKTNAWPGHIAMINGIHQTPDGRTQISITESNWNLDEKISHSRTMYADDPRIAGFIRPASLPIALRTGSGADAVINSDSNIPEVGAPFLETPSQREARVANQVRPSDVDAWTNQIRSGDATIANVPDKLKTSVAKRLDERKSEPVKAAPLNDKQKTEISKSKEKAAIDAGRSLLDSLQRYETFVDKYGWEGYGVGKTSLESAYADLKIKYKEAANLGALTGPDMVILQEAIKPSTGFGGLVGKITSGGVEGVKTGIQDTRDAVKRNMERAMEELKARYTGKEEDPYLQKVLQKPGSQETIRVKLKSSGQTGTIQANEFDENLYERI